MSKELYNLKLVAWSQVRDDVHKVNPAFAKLLEKIKPSDSAQLVYASYPFGVDFLKAGVFFLPWEDNHVIPATDPRIPRQIQKIVNYPNFPMGILLNKSVEVFYSTTQRVFPDKLWRKGTVIGVWEQLDKDNGTNTTRLSNLSIGARLIFMLQKISDVVSHKRLQRELNITSDIPNSLFQHRDLFAKLAHASQHSLKWRCEMVFLTNSWLNPKSKEQKLLLNNYILEECWRQSFNCRKQFEHHFEWEQILQLVNQKNIAFQSSIINHLNHLLAIGENIYPGLTFACENNEDIAPIKLLQSLYRDVYNLRGYAPLMMYPDYAKVSSPVYYSLNFPSCFQLPNKSVTPRLMDELRAVKSTMEAFSHNNCITDQYSFGYFNTTADLCNNIKPPETMMAEDPQLMKYFVKYSHEKFPSNSQVFKSCIRIDKS